MHTLTTTKQKKKRIGRGGARGKNSGHGHKGQKSRAGHRIRPALRDELQRIPKRRGHNKNRARGVRNRPAVRSVTLAILSRNFAKDERVTPSVLVARRLIAPVNGRVPKVKIVKRGEIAVPLVVSGCALSPGARKAVEDAGGKVE